MEFCSEHYLQINGIINALNDFQYNYPMLQKVPLVFCRHIFPLFLPTWLTCFQLQVSADFALRKMGLRFGLQTSAKISKLCLVSPILDPMGDHPGMIKMQDLWGAPKGFTELTSINQQVWDG